MILRLRRAVIVSGSLLAMASALAQQQSSQPSVLRIETGMHTAPIRAAAADTQGQILATASDDKTLRLWSLSTGELIHVLRPQIGHGAEGELKAVAMSPDGHFVVTGGWTGFEWEKANSLYIFETDTGRLVHRIGGLPEVINQLAWSPDGHHIAAGLAGRNGIRVFETGDWHEVFSDGNYTAPAYGLGFDASGRLAAAAFDGGIRLYDADFRIVATAKAPGGTRPYSVDWSPNGTVLAVGYNDTLNVDILSVPELRRIAAANTAGLSGGSMSRVAWTKDGALLAGGAYGSAATGSPIFRWTDDRKAKRQMLPAADGTVMGIVPLPDSGFVYVTADPSIGRYDAQLRRVLQRQSDVADFRGQLDRLRVSTDGARVTFGLEKGGGKPAWFEADARRLITGNPPGDLRSADVASLPVQGWRNDIAPSLSGKPLALEKNETSRSLAIAPDRQSFVLGAEWHLRRFDRNGEVIWSVALTYPAWAVNVSGDGRLAVAALANGTIRWYRYEDGWPLLALFMHRDGKHWVLWTPEGYYDASAGGEDLIGWYVNRGLDLAADYFPASRLREQYYRPDSVGTVLRSAEAGQPQHAPPGAASTPPTAPVLPPVVRILSPHTGEMVSRSPVEIRYSVRSPSGERVTGVDVLVNGRRQPDLPPAKGRDAGSNTRDAEQEASIEVPLEKSSKISLVAHAGDRFSEAVTIELVWKGPAETNPQKPSLYVLAIGISRYQDPSLALHFASADASDVAAALKSQEGGIYREVVERVLTDENATLRNVG